MAQIAVKLCKIAALGRGSTAAGARCPSCSAGAQQESAQLLHRGCGPVQSDSPCSPQKQQPGLPARLLSTAILLTVQPLDKQASCQVQA